MASYHHGDLRSELIREGLKILDRDGYKGFSLRKVASACKVTQTAPYRHFKDKDELIRAIALEALGRFNDSLQEAVDRHDDPADQLREMGCAYVAFFVENPEYLRLIFLSDFIGGVVTQAPAADHDAESAHPFRTFFQTLERYQHRYLTGGEHPMSLDELQLYCWSFVHGAAILLSRGELPGKSDGLGTAKKLIWNYLLPEEKK